MSVWGVMGGTELERGDRVTCVTRTSGLVVSLDWFHMRFRLTLRPHSQQPLAVPLHKVRAPSVT